MKSKPLSSNHVYFLNEFIMTFFYIKLHAKGFFIYFFIVFVVYTLKSIHDNVGWRELIKDVIPMEGRFEL
jgi:hypothetical protein